MTDNAGDRVRRGIEEILADVPRFKRESFEKARREMPHMTEEQLEAHWRYAAELLGIE